MSGVAALELFDGSSSLAETVSRLGMGDALSLLQAVGFGTGVVSYSVTTVCASSPACIGHWSHSIAHASSMLSFSTVHV